MNDSISAATIADVCCDCNSYKSVFLNNQTVEMMTANNFLRRGDKAVKPLWSPFWNEGEISVFFSETNVGKSILATQIANDIARGINSITGASVRRRKVVYFDYELSNAQFRDRYEGARFNNRFYRAAPYDDSIEFLAIESAYNDIVNALCDGAEAIIVDNITYLTSSINDASTVLDLLKRLKAKIRQYGASMLLITHTPKRSQREIITRADAAGSSYLLNFCDSAFTIGRSYLRPEYRYLKQIKNRVGEFTYTERNVLVGVFDKIDGLLQFRPVVEQREYLHLEK